MPPRPDEPCAPPRPLYHYCDICDVRVHNIGVHYFCEHPDLLRMMSLSLLAANAPESERWRYL